MSEQTGRFDTEQKFPAERRAGTENAGGEPARLDRHAELIEGALHASSSEPPVARGRRSWLLESVAAVSSGAGLLAWGFGGTVVWLGAVSLGLPAIVPGADLASLKPLEAVSLLAIAALPPAVAFGVLAGRRRTAVSDLFSGHLVAMDHALAEMDVRSRDLRRLSASSVEAAQAACERLAEVASRLIATSDAATSSAKTAGEAERGIHGATVAALSTLEALKELAQAAQSGAAANVDGLTSALDRAQQTVRELVAANQASQAAAREFSEGREGYSDVLAQMASAREAASENILGLRSAAEEANAAASALSAAAAQQHKDFVQVREDVTSAVAATADIVRQQSAQLTTGARRAVEAAEQVQRVLQEGTSGLEGAGAVLRAQTGELAAEFRGTVEQLQATADAVVAAKRSASSEARQLTAETGALVGVLKELATAITDGEGSSIRHATQAVSGLEQGIVAAITRLRDTASEIRREAESTATAVEGAAARADVGAGRLNTVSAESARKAEAVAADVSRFSDSIGDLGRVAEHLRTALASLDGELTGSRDGMRSLSDEAGGLSAVARGISDESVRLVASVEEALRRLRSIEAEGGASIGGKLSELARQAEGTTTFVSAKVEEIAGMVDQIGAGLVAQKQNFAGHRDEMALVGETVRLQADDMLSSIRRFVSDLDAGAISLVKAAESVTKLQASAPGRPWSKAGDEMRALGMNVAGRLRVAERPDALAIRDQIHGDGSAAEEAIAFARAVAEYVTQRDPGFGQAMETALSPGLPTPKSLYEAIRAAK